MLQRYGLFRHGQIFSRLFSPKGAFLTFVYNPAPFARIIMYGICQVCHIVSDKSARIPIGTALSPSFAISEITISGYVR